MKGASNSEVSAKSDTDFGNVRLSPIEKRNIALINDPALAGLHTGDASFSANPIPDREASSLSNESDPSILGRMTVDVLEIPSIVSQVVAGPNGPLATESVRVDADNPHFSTDGKAVYSKDGKTLVSMVVPCKEYVVSPDCEHIADRAFDTAEALERIKLPSGLKTIGRLAFAKSGLRSVELPDSLEVLGDKAFFCCRELVACLFGSGIRAIGDEAFAFSSLERAVMPASTEEIGHDVFEKTPAMRTSLDKTITIDRQNPVYSLDQAGGLYKNGAFAMMLSQVPSYSVRKGCKEVMDNACRRNVYLQSIELPEGLERIGDDAFHGCRNLSVISLPASLEHIGDRAFMDTRISHIDISANVSHIGEGALLVGGENPVRPHKPLHSLSLDGENERFYMESGILCERGAGEGGADKALIYVGPTRDVAIPTKVNRISPYAFLGATDIDELHVHGHLHSICEGAFSVARSIPRITVELISSNPEESPRLISLFVPSLSYRYRNYSNLFTTDRGRTVLVFSYYDAWVISTSDVREFTDAAIERLRYPIWMTSESKDLYRGIFERKKVAICEYLASNGDIDALEDLYHWGMTDVEGIDEVLSNSSDREDAQMIGCLLEAKRRFGKRGGLDLTI